MAKEWDKFQADYKSRETAERKFRRSATTIKKVG